MSRAKLGSGTQQPIKRVTPNKLALMKVSLEAGKALTVRQFQGILYDKGVRRWRRGDKTGPTGQWNYHTVQAELSLLVGNDLLSMTRSKELYDLGFEMYAAEPTPMYYLDWLQKIRYDSVQRNPKAVDFEKRPAWKRGLLDETKEEYQERWGKPR